jgi:hypothetical protein
MKTLWNLFSTIVYYGFVACIFIIGISYINSMKLSTGYSVTEEGYAKIPERIAHVFNMGELEFQERRKQFLIDEEEQRFQEWNQYHTSLEAKGIFHRKGWNTESWDRSNWDKWNK